MNCVFGIVLVLCIYQETTRLIYLLTLCLLVIQITKKPYAIRNLYHI